MKKILIGVAVIIVAIGGGIAYFLSSLDGLVKEAVETIGTDATLVKVSLNDVNISLKSGSGALNGLTIANPKGFKTESAFQLGGIKVALDTAQISGDLVVIKEIAIDGPKITYELGDGGSNIDAIKNNVDAYAKKFSSGETKEAEKSGEGPKLIIENLYIRGGEVGVSAAFLEGKALSTPLPDIHLKDIGKEEKGADPAQVVKEIIDSMTSGIGSAVGSLGLEKMMENAKGMAEGAVKAVEEQAGGAVKAIEEQTGGAGDAVSEGVGKAGEKLKNLLGN